ncbi:unnamed protein product [Urochloa humidicola]
MTRMRGTRGYLAPEWLGSKITEKADIYSFGIVMIEIICGRENLDESQPEESVHLISLLQEKARFGQLSDLVDSSSNDMRLHMQEVVEVMKLAMWCLQVDSSKRPLMSTIAKVLEGVMSIEEILTALWSPVLHQTIQWDQVLLPMFLWSHIYQGLGDTITITLLCVFVLWLCH